MTPYLFFAAAAAALLSAAGRLVNRRPGAGFRGSTAGAAFLVALSDMFSLSFLFGCVFLFASSCHDLISFSHIRAENADWIYLSWGV